MLYLYSVHLTFSKTIALFLKLLTVVSILNCFPSLLPISLTDLWEQWRVVVDVLEVDHDVGVPHQAVAAVVLGKHGEAPLGAAVRFVTVQGLETNKKFEGDSGKRI